MIQLRQLFIILSILINSFEFISSTPKVTCNGVVNTKIATIVKPKKLSSTCPIDIKLLKHTCQIRFDFKVFSFPQPTDGQCVDSFNFSPNIDSKTFHLCGENAGQHAYSFVDSNIMKKLPININLIRLERQIDWEINVRQIQCSNRLTNVNLTMANAGADDDDQYLRAPTNCFQYFPSMTGIVSTFNQNHPYLSQLDYKICFNTVNNQGFCGVRFKPSLFEVGGSQASISNENCDNVDYVKFISSGQIGDDQYSKICQKWGKSNEIIVTNDGGYSALNFHSGFNNKWRGFELNYCLIYNC